jgi:hypothetical protein
MLGNNNSQVIEIKTIDFSLINSDNTNDENENYNPNLIDLKNKVEALENKLYESNQIVNKFLDKINNDNLKLIELENKVVLLQDREDKNNIKVKLEELSSEIVKNSNQLKDSKLIKNIIEDSFRTMTNSNIKNNILENDLAIRENKLQLDRLTVNIKQTVNNEINKQIQEAFDSLFNNLLIEQVESILTDRFNSLYDEKTRLEEQLNNDKELKEATDILGRQRQKEEEEYQIEVELAKKLIDQQNEFIENQKNLEEEGDKRKLQEKEDNILLEIIKGELTTYTTNPYTFYAYVEGLDINNSIIGFFVKNGDTYELRAKTTNKSFFILDGKMSVTLNVQLSGDETSFIIKALYNDNLVTPKNNINDKIIELKPGGNNFVTIDTLSTLHF